VFGLGIRREMSRSVTGQYEQRVAGFGERDQRGYRA